MSSSKLLPHACTVDEWRKILAAELCDVHQWPLPLINFVIDYVHDIRLVIIGYDTNNHAIIMWSLSYRDIRIIMAASAAASLSGKHRVFSWRNNEQ